MKHHLPSTQVRSRGRRRSDIALAFLAHLADDFSIFLALDELLTRVTRTCRTELGFESCSVALVDDSRGGELRVRAASGLRNGYLDLTIPAGQGLHGEVIRTQRPLSVPDLTSDRRAYRPQPVIGSGIYAPLIVRGRAVGVLSAHRAAKDGFTQIELELLSVVARYVAGAVEVARLHEQLTEQAHNWKDQLTQALDLVHVAMIIATLEDGTILRWNRAAADVYGYAPEDIVGRRLDLLEPPDRKGWWRTVLTALRHGEPVLSLDAIHLTKDGGSRRVALTAHPMRNASGNVRWALINVTQTAAEPQTPAQDSP